MLADTMVLPSFGVVPRRRDRDTSGDTGASDALSLEKTRRFGRNFDAEGWPSGRWRWCTNPLAFTTILTMGGTGTNLATGQRNQPTAQTDPDSLKLTPLGDLQLSSGDDGQLALVSHPGTDEQAVSFITLLDPQDWSSCLRPR